MKKLIITILALVVLSLALSAQVYYKDEVGTKQANVYGYVYHWSPMLHMYVPTPNEPLHSKLFADPSDVPNAWIADEPGVTDQNGYYEIYFPYPYNVPQYGYIGVYLYHISGDEHYSDYDGHTQVDIYIGGPPPTPDNTIPIIK